MPERDFSIGDAVSFGWDATKNNLGFFIPAVLILWVAGAIPGGIQSLNYYMSTGAAVAWSGIFSIVSLAVSIFINMAEIRIGLKFCDGDVADFPDMLADYRKFLDVLVGSILYFLIVLAGFILLIVPGIYWAVRYHLFGYLILDQEYGPVDAIRRSGELTRGVWWHLFAFWLVLLGIGILGFLACCVGLLFAFPVIIVAVAYVYRTLLAVTPESGVVPPPAIRPPAVGPPVQPGAPGAPAEPAGEPSRQAPPEPPTTPSSPPTAPG